LGRPAVNNKMVWREGTFIYPQHFQQMESYVESSLESAIKISTEELAPHCGFFELTLNDQVSKLSQVAISHAMGQFPDGKFFNQHQEIYKNIPADIVSEVLYLAVPLYAIGQDNFSNKDKNCRYQTHFETLQDLTTQEQKSLEVELAALNLQLKLASEDFSGFARLAVTKILEVSDTGEVILDKSFIPQCLTLAPASYLISKIKEINALAKVKTEQLMTRIQSATDMQNNIALYNDQQILQKIYHWLPWLEALEQSPKYKIGRMYLELKQFEADLASVCFFTRQAWQPLQNENIFAAINPVLSNIKNAVSISQKSSVQEIEWDRSLFNSRRMLLAKIHFADLNDSSRIIITVNSETEQLKELFYNSCKLAGNRTIINLIKNALPGINIIGLPFAPPELKGHQSTQYFQVDVSHEIWRLLIQNKELLALHIDSRIEIDDVKLFLIN